MNTKINNIIHLKVKILHLRKYTDIIQEGKYSYLKYDDSKDNAVCLGIIIDGFVISLIKCNIYPIYEASPNTELNKYYVVGIYDYGEPIKIGEKYIQLIEEDTEKLQKWYIEAVNWYENLKNKKMIKLSIFKSIK